MPLFKSFRSKSSLKSSASVLSENDATSDFGPRSPSTNTFASKKNSEFGSMGRANKHHGGNQMTSSPSSASVRTSQSVALQSQQPNMMDAVSGGRPPASTDAGPRPSELFAGKGVQWDSVKLAGPGSSPAVQTRSTTNNTEDLQNFLKQRRQWKPTFITEESVPRTQTPTDLSKLSFLSQDSQVNKNGLMSFDDLDKSHQRKQQLLGDNPLGASPSLWEEAETSKAGAAKAGHSKASSQSKNPPSRPVESVTRSGSDFKTSRKAVSGSISTQGTAGPQAPVRASSSQRIAGPAPAAAQTPSAPLTNGSNKHPEAEKVNAPDRSALPPPITAAPAAAVAPTEAASTAPAGAGDTQPGAVRQSIETSGGFATPDTSSRPESSQDLTAAGGASAGVDSNGDAQNLSVHTGKTEAAAGGPATPRAPKQGDVSVDHEATPTRASAPAS